MKRLLVAATAGFIALSGAASAMTVDAIFEHELRSVAPGVDASTLTDTQINAIKQALASGDSWGQVRSYVYSIING